MRRRGWWLAGLASLLALLALGLGAAVAFMDPNDLKPLLVATVEQATGRTFTLGGPLRISLSLWPTIEVSNIQLANLPGGTRPDMARAERIEAQISLPALLRHRLEITRLTLVGPNILFEQVGDTPNWVFDTPGSAPANTPYTSRFREVHVQDGMVTFRLPGSTRVVGLRTLDFQRPAEGGPIDLTSVLVYSDNQPFSLTARARPTGADVDPWTTNLSFAAFGATATGHGAMSLGGDYDMQVDGSAPALEKLNALLPAMRLPALHQVMLATHLTSPKTRGDLPVIGATKLHFASAELSDRVAGLHLGSTDLLLSAAGAPAVVAALGSYRDQHFKLTGAFGVPEHLAGRASEPIDLTLEAEPGPGSAKGSLGVKGRLALDAGRFAGLDAGIALRTPALDTLRALVSPNLPALTDLSLDGRLVVPASLATLALHDAKLTTKQLDLSGQATVGLTAELVIDAKLQAARLDLDALLDPAPTEPVPGSGALIPGRALPWAMLRGPRITLDATVGTLTYAHHPWTGVSIALQLQDGSLQVSHMQLAEPAGAVVGSLTATDRGAVSLTLLAPGIPLAEFAAIMGLPGASQGALHLDSQLRAEGQTLAALAASLDGTVSATMGGGGLSNAALVKLAGVALQALNITIPPQGQTDIRCLGLVGAFDKGVGRFRTIAIDTTYLALAGAGQIDLRAETLALRLHPLARLAGSSVSVPVVVDGPFRAPSARLDADGLDKIGLMVDAWFGGDKPDICGKSGLVAR